MKKRSFIILLATLITPLCTEEYKNACKDLSLFYKNVIPYIKELKSYNDYIQSKYGIDNLLKNDLEELPNLVMASETFTTGIIISFRKCLEVLTQKHSICRSMYNANPYYSITYPRIDFSIENDRKILKEGYQLIKEKQKSISKRL